MSDSLDRAEKAMLREEAKALRAAMSEVERMRGSRRATDYLQRTKVFRQATIVALFAALPDEADPRDLEDDFDRRTYLYPRIDQRHLEFRMARRRELVPTGKYKIPEPTVAHPAQELFRADIVVVPGLYFTASGARLGYGAGFYDRALRRARVLGHPTPPLAVAFGFWRQIVEELPITEHDELVDAIAHEQGITACTERGRALLET